SCPRLAQWMADLDPAGITLVFPESYINNPASMFGHTLLRIEQHASRSALLAPSINFSAITEESPGLLYAVKGLFGGYSGKFSKGLYVDQVRSYGALENRDIYEYTLGLSDSETRFLLLHVFELKRAAFDYFFFDENCSYQLLSLIEAARPSLDLTDHIHVASIPVDTIRQVVSLPGMLRGVEYRPSLRSNLTRKTSHLSSLQLELVAELADKGRVGNDPRWLFADKTQQAGLLDAAIDLVLYNQSAATGKNDASDPLLLQLLQARSLLPAGTQSMNNNMPAVRPDQGHGTARFSFGPGVDHSDYFFDAGFRPVLHDLMDPGPGYVDGAEVEFFSPTLRFYPDKNQLVFQQLKLLDIVSLTPGDKLIKPISWLVYIGMDQRRYAEGGDRLTGRVKAGFGGTTQMSDGLEGYCLLTGQLFFNGHFQYGLNAAPGVVGGVRTTGHERWNSVLQGESGYSLLPDAAWSWSLKFMQSLHIIRNFSLRVYVAREREFASPSTEISFSLHWYF
ncbi:MAG TPA: DUF4105 domain-containing protein, partial [Desulfobulbaceae bacterium]|nr:DUF4105 domain-containing protein [Desulfobulbaceae bacterium]